MSKKGNCLGDRDHCCGLGNPYNRQQIRACSQSTLAKRERTGEWKAASLGGTEKGTGTCNWGHSSIPFGSLVLDHSSFGQDNKVVASVINLTYLDYQRKPGVNTLMFSSFILILVLIGWPELLSVLWWYNPRDRFPKITFFKFTFDLLGFVAAHSSSKYSDRYVSFISPNVYSFL